MAARRESMVKMLSGSKEPEKEGWPPLPEDCAASSESSYRKFRKKTEAQRSISNIKTLTPPPLHQEFLSRRFL
jgi:hypothetical protein